MLKLEGVIGSATDPVIAHKLHHLGHHGKVEYLTLSPGDTQRHRLRAATDAGTECAVILERTQHLYNGAVLMLDEDRAIVVRMREPQWLGLEPQDLAAALELGYLAGNMHWSVRFEREVLRIALAGPEQDYLDRLRPMLVDGRVRKHGRA
jgi:urease accessory protein